MHFFLTLVVVGLFALTLAYVLFADHLCLVVINNLSILERDPITHPDILYVLTSVTPSARTGKALSPQLHSKSMGFGDTGPMVRGWTIFGNLLSSRRNSWIRSV